MRARLGRCVTTASFAQVWGHVYVGRGVCRHLPCVGGLSLRVRVGAVPAYGVAPRTGHGGPSTRRDHDRRVVHGSRYARRIRSGNAARQKRSRSKNASSFEVPCIVKRVATDTHRGSSTAHVRMPSSRRGDGAGTDSFTLLIGSLQLQHTHAHTTRVCLQAPLACPRRASNTGAYGTAQITQHPTTHSTRPRFSIPGRGP